MEKLREQEHSFRFQIAGNTYNDFMRPKRSQGVRPLYMEFRELDDRKWQATHNDYFLEDRKREIYLSTSGQVRKYGKPDNERLNTDMKNHNEWTMEW